MVEYSVRHDSVVDWEVVDVDENCDEVCEVRLDGEPIGRGPDEWARELTGQIRSAIHRAGVVFGLRALADHLESNADLPTPGARAYLYAHGVAAKSGRRMKLVRQVIAGLGSPTVTESPGSLNELCIERDFGGGVKYHLNIDRESICTPEIVDGKVVWRLPEELQALVDAGEAS